MASRKVFICKPVPSGEDGKEFVAQDTGINDPNLARTIEALRKDLERHQWDHSGTCAGALEQIRPTRSHDFDPRRPEKAE